MDLKKAKMILIVFFLIINAVLVSIIIFSDNSNKVSRNIINNVYELFEKNGKSIVCKIPEDSSPVSQLEMGKEVRGGNIEGIKALSDKIGFDTSGYKLFYDFGEYKLYYEEYKGYKILENRIKEYDDHIEYLNREIIRFDKNKKSIIPAHVILIKEYLYGKAIKIEKIEMIYIKYADEDIFGPAWCMIADGNVRYFYALDAFNGIELKQDQ